MEIKTIDQRFSTAGQLDATDLEEVARQGFKLVINFRPDGEGGETQPASASLAAQAASLGLAYAHIPVVPNQVQPAHVAELSALLKQHPGPALGFCRTGNRANSIYQQVLQAEGPAKPACCQSQPEDASLSSRVMGWIKR